MIEALRSAGATEEILALVQSCFEACLKPTGRPRKHANRTERERAYRARRKELAKRHAASPEAFVDGRIDTTDGRSLRTRLIDACDLDDVETRAGFRLAEVWGRYDFAMGRRRQAASPSYEAGRGRGEIRSRLSESGDHEDDQTLAA